MHDALVIFAIIPINFIALLGVASVRAKFEVPAWFINSFMVVAGPTLMVASLFVRDGLLALGARGLGALGLLLGAGCLFAARKSFPLKPRVTTLPPDPDWN